MSMQLRAVIPTLCVLLIAGCGGGGSGSTVTIDPTTVFLPITVSAVSGSTIVGPKGLFVVSAKSPADPPIQITTTGIDSIGLQAQYTLSAQGTASTGNPYRLIYTTLNSPGGDHVWSLKLSGTSTLVPTQLSNLTIPYYTAPFHGGGVTAVQWCANRVIPKNLADPSSAFVILALPTDATLLCSGSTRWLLIHSSDGPATDPINLPALSGPILPLYRPDGTLAGLVAIDASNNLNFYPDETFTHPQLLLANVGNFTPEQEAQAGPISRISANPTYSFIVVQASNSVSGAPAVYRVDYTGSISADLYDVVGSPSRWVVDSGNLYFTTLAQTGGDLYEESVGRIPGGGEPVQILTTTSPLASNRLPTLAGVSGSNLVFWGSTPELQWYVETLPAGAPGAFTTIATYGGVPQVSLAGGDIFVTWANVSTSPQFEIQYASQILDSTGNVLQAYMPSSSFVSNGAPVMQVRNITDSSFMGGGGVYALDLSNPASPTPVALKTAAGTAFDLPSGTQVLSFSPITSTIGVADGSLQGGATTGSPDLRSGKGCRGADIDAEFILLFPDGCGDVHELNGRPRPSTHRPLQAVSHSSRSAGHRPDRMRARQTLARHQSGGH